MPIAGRATQVQHRMLVGKDDADRRRRYWNERLFALRDVIENRAGHRRAS